MKVSVIMPLYNSIKYVKESINSVLNQTYKDLELIIINDNSSDGVEKILNLYQCNSRVTILNNDENIGVAMSRNIGLDLAKGEIIAFCDSDDVWDINKLQRQITYLKNTSKKVVCSSAEEILEDGSFNGKVRSIPNNISKKTFKYRNYVILSSSIHNRSDIRFRSVFHEDYDYWWNLCANGFVFEGVQEPLLKYRMREGSITSKKINSLHGTFKRIYSFNNSKIVAIYMFGKNIFSRLFY
ncbi:glycosyltransferase [Gammaproteobacteria bacterium]|nr:glycosyltransferase [Gammaproteobacteria bacterium]